MAYKAQLPLYLRRHNLTNLAKFLGLIVGLLIIVQVAGKHFGFHLIPKYESN